MLTTAPISANANATGADRATFKITNTKRFVPIVTLSEEDNAKLSNLLSEGIKRFIYWNKYKVMDNKVGRIDNVNEEKYITERLDASYQGVNRLFVLAYDNTAGNNQVSVDSFKKYFLPRVKIENYNMEIDQKNFYYQPINDTIQQYDEIRKIQTGQVDDYTTGCLLDFAYFEKSYKLITADLSKQLIHADSRTIQQSNSSKYKSNNFLHSRTIKRNNVSIFKRNNKSVVTTYKWLNTVK